MRVSKLYTCILLITVFLLGTNANAGSHTPEMPALFVSGHACFTLTDDSGEDEEKESEEEEEEEEPDCD